LSKRRQSQRKPTAVKGFGGFASAGSGGDSAFGAALQWGFRAKLRNCDLRARTPPKGPLWRSLRGLPCTARGAAFAASFTSAVEGANRRAAQPDRALPSRGRRWAFESPRLDHFSPRYPFVHERARSDLRPPPQNKTGPEGPASKS